MTIPPPEPEKAPMPLPTETQAETTQMSVEFKRNGGDAEWLGQHTGLSDWEDAKRKAADLFKALTKDHPFSKVRICETPFGKVLARVNRAGAVVPTEGLPS